MQITEHFTREEMERSSTATRLGLSNVCPDDLLPNMLQVATALEVVRKAFGKPIHVTSCYRSPAVNAAVGGSTTSAHRFAYAADFEVADTGILEVCKWCAANILNYDQIIYEFGETGWIHIGFAKEPRRQLLTAIKKGGKTVYSQGLG